MNCFLAYRLDKQVEIAARCPGANHRDISKIIAKWWREASEEEKAPYRERARLAKIEHAKLYPNYKYRPVKKLGRKTRKYLKRPANKFTSRSEENNRMMELFYHDPATALRQPNKRSRNTTNAQSDTKKSQMPLKKQPQREHTTAKQSSGITWSAAPSMTITTQARTSQSPSVVASQAPCVMNEVADTKTVYFGQNVSCQQMTINPQHLFQPSGSKSCMSYVQNVFAPPSPVQKTKDIHFGASMPYTLVQSSPPMVFDPNSPVSTCASYSPDCSYASNETFKLESIPTTTYQSMPSHYATEKFVANSCNAVEPWMPLPSAPVWHQAPAFVDPSMLSFYSFASPASSLCYDNLSNSVPLLPY
ncbi:uncharacterized protein BYT42DRAFT_611652 [Radiomyces spectabilis]|uniref:uncharacterized protein n=1 Tax=Radiomyces spectabilis TaxID=64574 RepID=UPI00222033E5|nr:uncharacterized protein BYT42DRAFT_611652 [Radiomyces spectabilis]KAI8388630.1 hypothetical protein BYT42DRAFT_611652 [Radiomyces spectabilis]